MIRISTWKFGFLARYAENFSALDPERLVIITRNVGKADSSV